MQRFPQFLTRKGTTLLSKQQQKLENLNINGSTVANNQIMQQKLLQFKETNFTQSNSIRGKLWQLMTQ
jgi:hypothetical protein